ncbi:hypothetical protein BIW11_02201 [Tropilaelaps mercedesae]|uniref:PWWP domain-containing protein n=1 Tax=Tropilaelaps mercedesae TaxID=418985 RepID=A0A1V9X1Y2_9ACAR|nr:hypothetical protein BIW11_02201 [Tropilaelaps mercedesae]
MAERRRPPVSVVAASTVLHSDYPTGPLAKGTRLSVTVVEALRDLIVVSLDHNSRIYQGALLDTTNRSIKPFCTSPFPKTEDSAEDEAMFALKMRHTYVVSSRENEAPFNGGVASQGTGKPIEPTRDKRGPRAKIDQHVRMRKLRPRQTLCSNCQSRCDEPTTGPTTTTANRGSAKKNTAPLVSVVRGTRDASHTSSLEASQGSGGGGELLPPAMPTQTSPSPWTEETPPQADVYASVAEDALIKEELPSSAQMPEAEQDQHRLRRPEERPPDWLPVLPDRPHHQDPKRPSPSTQAPMTLRKRRAVSITVISSPEERRTTRADVKAQQHQSQPQHYPTPQQSPVIKISFNNPQGKGTVVKIPAKVAVADYEETTSDDEEKDDFSPLPSTCGAERNTSQDGRASVIVRGRRRTRESIAEENSNAEGQLVPQTPVKHHKHKAGKINRSFLSKKTYSGKHKRKRHKTSGGDSGADSDGESVPDFPQAAVERDHAKDADAVPIMDVKEPLRKGDIVWGKVMGFPWWPGRILSLGAEDETPSAAESSNTALQNGEAHVAWFGSSTSSRILTSSLAPFLRDFKLRYNRRKRGPYKEAIRQASQEAKARSKSESV